MWQADSLLSVDIQTVCAVQHSIITQPQILQSHSVFSVLFFKLRGCNILTGVYIWHRQTKTMSVLICLTKKDKKKPSVFQEVKFSKQRHVALRSICSNQYNHCPDQVWGQGKELWWQGITFRGERDMGIDCDVEDKEGREEGILQGGQDNLIR